MKVVVVVLSLHLLLEMFKDSNVTATNMSDFLKLDKPLHLAGAHPIVSRSKMPQFLAFQDPPESCKHKTDTTSHSWYPLPIGQE